MQQTDRTAAAQPGLVRALARHLLRTVGLQPSGTQADAEYPVWYATSRKPLDRANPSLGFGVERDHCIHYGICKVFIPKSHKVGSTGSPWWKRLLSATDDRMRVLTTDSLQVDAFFQKMQQHLRQSNVEDQDAVVFIHGFNVSFEEAALRAAQIGFDLQIKGAMAFYSWASRGSVKMYPADEASVELEETPIADFLCDMAMRTGARRVHVIAHSMGNRGLLRAVSQIAQNAERRSGVRFGQIILAAADIDARKFQELCKAYTLLSERTTLYVSSRDIAVEASGWLHDFPRAGLMPPITTAAGIDTVNATNADVSLLGHGYVAEARDVISDIHALIRHGAAPAQRFGLRLATTVDGAPYWLIGA
ncbi:alpha/beta hydrolase [Ahniella affigens]|nr:alpha/beta hydrolase [Ahniella affigens]